MRGVNTGGLGKELSIMSRRRNPRDSQPADDQPTDGEATQGELRAEEFEEVELPTEAPAEEEAEFEEPDLTGAQAAAGPTNEALLAARDRLEQDLLLGVTER